MNHSVVGGALPNLAPGDRAPDFVLPTRDEKLYSFYERVRGAPDPAATGPTGRAIARGALRTVFADVTGKVLAGFCQLLGDPGQRPTCLLLDTNQRLIVRLDGDDPAAVISALATLPTPGPALTLGDSASVLLPDVIEPAFCAALIDQWRNGGHAGGSVEAVVDGQVEKRVLHGRKRRLDHEIHDEAPGRALAGRIIRRIGPELEKVFRFRGFRLDRFLIGNYQAERGDYFRPQRDNLAPTTRDRMFALSLNLNDDYEGGDVWFPGYGPHRYRPPAGGALVFSCSLIHEALSVTRDERFVLLSFLRESNRSGPRPS